MKIMSLFLVFLLGGCAIDITPKSFIHQSKTLEPGVKIEEIQGKMTQDPALISLSKISLTKDGTTLKGVKFIHANATVNIVLFGGNGMKISSSSAIFNEFALLPANVIWFDYRGVGVSEKTAEISVAQFKADALNTFDFAKAEFPEQLPTVVHGLSMGSLLASFVASERDVDALVLDGAINSVPKLVDNLIPFWLKIFSSVTISDELTQIDNVELIKKVNKPMLLLIGDADSTTPVAFSKELYQASPSSNKVLEILPDTGHSQPMTTAKAILAYQSFIASLDCCAKTL